MVSVELDAGLIIMCIIVPFILLATNFIGIVHFIHPDDAAGAKFPKVVVLIGMVFAECAVLLLPLDVGNRGGLVGCGYWNNECGGLDMDIVWQIVYVAIAGLVVIVLPYTIFYYEADERDAKQKERIWWTALKYLLITVVVSVTALVILYALLRQTYIPVKYMTVGTNWRHTWFPVDDVPNLNRACGGGCTTTDHVLKMDVTFVIFLAGLLAFLGWFLFVIYASIGFIALPMDFFNAFIHRRKLLSHSAVVAYQKALQGRAEQLIAMSDALKEEWADYNSVRHSPVDRRKQRKIHEVQLNKLRVLVDTLEGEAEDLRMSSPAEFKNNNILVPWMKLLAGIITTILTLAWLTHIVIYMLLDETPFINDYLIWFDGWFPLFGTLTVGVFAIYLLLAVIKGNFKFGSRFFLIKIHPMVPHKTFVNSMIFNLMLVLLCVLPVVQFASNAFRDYARLTSVDVIFGSTIKHMEGFRYFFENDIFLYSFLGLTFLALVYFVWSPSEKKRLQKETAAHRDALASSRDAALKQRQRQRK
uniref:Uncharacterized protein n=1 Tax=Bicosoecida sp. CB-2014 TaxID=1486930 RepID=A0A7S1GBQ8_9STRA